MRWLPKNQRIAVSGNGSQRHTLTSTSRIFQTKHSWDSKFLSTQDHSLMLHTLEFGGNRSCIVTEFRATVWIIDRFVRLLIAFPDRYIGFIFLAASSVRAEILYSKYFSLDLFALQILDWSVYPFGNYRCPGKESSGYWWLTLSVVTWALVICLKYMHLQSGCALVLVRICQAPPPGAPIHLFGIWHLHLVDSSSLLNQNYFYR